jgi:hypothetical protein
VAPRFLMCGRHWRMVDSYLQSDVWAHYVPGQELRKDPTMEYLRAAQAAIDCVARKEGRHV